MLKKNTDKAYIKDTGEILDVMSKYMTFQVKVTIPNDPKLVKLFEDSGIAVDYEDLKFDKTSIENEPDSWINKYQLSDGKTYDSKELIVGNDNIRNIHLNKILE